MKKIIFILIFIYCSFVPGKTLKPGLISGCNDSEKQNYSFLPVSSDTTEDQSENNSKDIDSDSSGFINYGINLLWQQSLDSTNIEALPLIWDNKIYIATKDGYVDCFDKNGKQLWQTYISGTIVSQPAAADNYVAVGTLEGDITSLNAKTGKVLQTIGIGEPVTAPLTAFEYLGPRDIIIDNDNLSTSIAIGTQSGKLYCYDLSSFGFLWESDIAKAELLTKPLYKDNKLMYLDNGGYLYCLDSRSGKMIWKWSEKKPNITGHFTNPVSNDKDIFLSLSDKSLAAVDMLLGKSEWFKDNLNGKLSINLSRDSTKIFAISSTKKFYITSAADGKIIKEIDLISGIDTVPCPPVEINNSILSNSSDGIIFQIDKDFNQIPLLSVGNSILLSIQPINRKSIIAVTSNGSIFVFEIKH